MTTHSHKAQETLRLLGTEGSDWYHPEVKWVLEERVMAVRETCPDCRGWRRVGIYEEVPGGKRYTGKDRICERCADSRGRTGTCIVTKPRQVWVGYIQWPAGTRHDVSRFGYGGKSLEQCELCGHGINKSGRVPVVTTKDGDARAMWVGEDCARKFASVKRAKPVTDAKTKKFVAVLADNMESK